MEIAPGIHHIQNARGPKVYLLVDRDLTLIDTGFPGNARPIAEYISGLGRDLSELNRILITHSHPDHTASVAAIKAISPAQAFAHPADTTADSKGRPLISYLNIFGALPIPVPFLRRVYADMLLEDGQELPILGGLRVLHTPGHTPGSVCYYLPSERVIFLGDMVVSSRGRIGGSMPYPKTNMRLYEQSLQRIAQLDFDIACLSHGNVLNGNADQRIRRMLDWYLRMSMWLRIARTLPPVFRLGRQTGFKEP
ncbi:MAG: MBL fold metallo-hydrolase [Chloroflexi bacterium]|nr:MBL fold metallo-hydrolase [Chloroflexota bacterium]